MFRTHWTGFIRPNRRCWLDSSFPKKRNDWRLGRWTAKKAVKHYLAQELPDLSLPEIAIIAAEDGAPEVFFEEEPLPAFISLSHSHGTCFCTVSEPGNKLGCDLEKIEPRSDNLIRDYFTENEQARIAATHDSPLWANLIWSAKESTLKAIREGLRVDTRLVDVDFVVATEKLNWHRLSAVLLNEKILFHGYWQYSADFVYTLLCECEDFELEEIL
jgi:4'-phosphopantetheinyl transferase